MKAWALCAAIRMKSARHAPFFVGLSDFFSALYAIGVPGSAVIAAAVSWCCYQILFFKYKNNISVKCLSIFIYTFWTFLERFLIFNFDVSLENESFHCCCCRNAIFSFAESPNKIADFCTFCSGYCFCCAAFSFLCKKSCYFGYHFDAIDFRFDLVECMCVFSIHFFRFANENPQKKLTSKWSHMTCVIFKMFNGYFGFQRKNTVKCSRSG